MLLIPTATSIKCPRLQNDQNGFIHGRMLCSLKIRAVLSGGGKRDRKETRERKKRLETEMEREGLMLAPYSKRTDSAVGICFSMASKQEKGCKHSVSDRGSFTTSH